MTTIGWLCILVGSILIRQAAKGRSAETGEDLRDYFIAFVSADWDEVSRIAHRPASPILDSETIIRDGEPGNDTWAGDVPGSHERGTALINEMVRLGESAKGYKWGGVGPTYYDCSGIMWVALKNLKLYNGPRFTTDSWANDAKDIADRVDTPRVGDVVVWDRSGGQSGHMGVVTGADKFYSARSSHSVPQIGTATISSVSKTAISTEYWRLK